MDPKPNLVNKTNRQWRYFVVTIMTPCVFHVVLIMHFKEKNKVCYVIIMIVRLVTQSNSYVTHTNGTFEGIL